MKILQINRMSSYPNGSWSSYILSIDSKPAATALNLIISLDFGHSFAENLVDLSLVT